MPTPRKTTETTPAQQLAEMVTNPTPADVDQAGPEQPEPGPVVDNLASALARAQGKLQAIVKAETATVPGREGRSGYTYSYANLADVTLGVLPVLAAEGLSWTCLPTVDQGGTFVLLYQLMHGPSGESLTGRYPLGDPMRQTPQQIGSLITYARRYCLTAVTGAVTDVDDDGAAASQPAADPRREQAQTPKVVPADEQPARAEWWRERIDSARTLATLVAARRDSGLEGLHEVPVKVLVGEDWKEPTLLQYLDWKVQQVRQAAAGQADEGQTQGQG